MSDIPADLLAALAQRFELRSILGRGGMATVYLGHDRKHQRDVAVKVLRPDLAVSIGADRFLKEPRTAVGTPIEPPKKNVLIGGPTRLWYERVIEGEVPESEFPVLVDEIRLVLGNVGQLRRLLVVSQKRRPHWFPCSPRAAPAIV